MGLGICSVRSWTWVGVCIATSVVLLTLACCSSAPGKAKGRWDSPFGPVEVEREYDRQGPAGPLPPGWTPTEQQNLCFTSRGKEYCVTVCIARHSGTDCVYIKHGGCDTSSGWILYCPSSASSESMMLVAANVCWSTSIAVSYNPVTEGVSVEYTVACASWVDDDLVGVFIAHPSAPGTFLDSDTFRTLYGNHMPVGSRVQFSGNAEETAWNTFQLKADLVEFETTTGEEVVTAIVNGTDIPPFAITVVDDQIVDVRAVYDPR